MGTLISQASAPSVDFGEGIGPAKDPLPASSAPSATVQRVTEDGSAPLPASAKPEPCLRQSPVTGSPSTDEMIAQVLQQEEEGLFLEAKKFERQWDKMQQSDSTTEGILQKLKSQTLTTLADVGQFVLSCAGLPGPDEVTADRKRLLLRLAFYGLKEMIVEGDGNCQFRALAHQLWRNEAGHRHVRSLVVERLRAYAEQYAPFITSEDYGDYVARMAQDGTWGDHVTLQAAADVFDAEVVLVTSFPDDRSVICIRPTAWEGDTAESRARQTLWLSFYAEIHYNSIDTR